MSTSGDVDNTKESITSKNKFNSLNPGRFFTEIKKKILHHNGSSKKNSQKRTSKIFDETIKSDSSCRSSNSKKSLINKSLSSFSSSNDQTIKKKLKDKKRITRTRNSIIIENTDSKNSKNFFEKKFKFSSNLNRDTKPKYNINSSIDSLGCSTVLSDFSSVISSFSSSSIEDRAINNQPMGSNCKTFKPCQDLKFRKELERIISSSSAKIDLKPKQSGSEVKFFKPDVCLQKSNINQKLRSFMSSLSETLIKDYSELLVDHENKIIIKDDHSDINEESLQSILSDTSSLSDLTDSTVFNLLFKSDNKAMIDDDKMVKILISMLVKSCRVFDVATMKTDSKVSYWRYANPLIAVQNFGKTKRETQRFSAGTQTCDKEENSATSTNMQTVMEIKKSGPILEMASESLVLSTLHDDDSNYHIYENEIFLNFLDKSPIYENCDSFDESSEKSIKESHVDSLIKNVQKIVINEPALYENDDFFEDIKNTPSCTKPRASSKKYLFGRSRNGSILFKRNSFLNVKSNQNRAQDETLRDAENLSDLENESDIDEWIDLTELKQELFLINNEKIDNRMTKGDVDQKFELKNLNENFDPESNIGHENNNNNNSLSLSLSSSSSSSSVSLLTLNYSKQQQEKILIDSFHKKNLFFNKKPKSTNRQNRRKTKKTNSNSLKTKLNTVNSTFRVSLDQPACLYKKDKNKKFNFTHFDNSNNNKNNFHLVKNCHLLYSIMHECENTKKSLETFLKDKKYESQTFNSQTKIFKKNFENEMETVTTTTTRLRTHSLDSLEEEKNEEFTIECGHYEPSMIDVDVNITQIDTIEDDTPEIKIDFEYQIIDEQNQVKKTFSDRFQKSITSPGNAYTIGDLKSSNKFNEENIVKQRARESLKFWKTEEEKFKQDNDVQTVSSNIVQNSIFHTQNPLIASLKRVNSRERKINSNLESSSNGSQDRLNETTDQQQVTTKRVKDRINIFESKFQENKTNAPVMKIKKGSQSSFERETKSITSNTFMDKIEKKSSLNSNTVQSRIESLENKCEQKQPKRSFRDELDEQAVKDEEICVQTYIDNLNEEETITSTQTYELADNETRVTKLEILENSDSFDSDKIQVEETFFENQIIEYKCDKNDGQIQISTCTLDKKKTINLSLNSLSSEYVLEHDDQQTEKTEEINYINEQIVKSSTHVSIVEEKRSSLSLQEKSESESEEEEIEILINLNNETKKSIDEEKINEILRNVVMHLIPTTRKAYVDDIVDGIKSQLSLEDLDKINSPIDLPKDIVRFVQKRYTNLLNENISETEKQEQNKETSIEIVIDSDKDSVTGIDTLNSPFYETTKLTMVKEIRKEIMSSSESEIKSEIKEENVLKVDEETLYIVEKIRQIKSKTEECEKQLDTALNTNYVDNEIRKNFELKPKVDENIDRKRERDLKFLINDLKKSIFKSNLHFSEMQSHGLINEINDYQLHYFNMANTQENDQSSILVILFDKQNDENLKYGLEQNYQKSIVDTHLSLNRKANINIVAHLNLYYIDDIDSDVNLKDDFYESHASYINLVNNSKFYEFSIFKRLKDAHQLSHLTDVSTYFLPIGKYFVKIHYKHVIHTNDFTLNKVINETRTEKESIVDLSLLPLAIRAQLVYECELFVDKKTDCDMPEVNILAVDSFLLQMEINKKRDDLIRNIIIKQFNYTPKQADEFLTKKKSFNELENLNEFIIRLEADLDSYYICEKVESLTKELNNQRCNEDLVKLNKLDALASFKCVQKYKLEITEILKDSNNKVVNFDGNFKKFYLIDNGNHYKCMLPVEDLNDSYQDETLNQVEDKDLTDNSIVIEHIQKRQNYIFSKDLQNVFNENSVSNEPVSSDKISNNNPQNESKKNYNKNELHLENYQISNESRELRDKIISNQVYKMFNSIRDHQSSTVKAKGEMNVRGKKKRSGTWGYSSDKRHVIAKVMELPYVEDMTQLTKKTGITDLKDLEKSILNNDEDTSEKVFVRIDDFLNKKVSQSIQRSYSFDYLNKNAGPKIRIKYVKIPSQTIKAHHLPYDSILQSSDYRTAPYDLRYLSILKLLEEERQSQAQYFEPCKPVESKNVSKHLTKPEQDVKTKKDMENFLSKNKIDEEIQKVKHQVKPTPQPVQRPSQPNRPTYVIKEKSVNNVEKNSVILNRIDSELAKIDRASLQNQKKSLTQPNLTENVRIYDLPEQNLDALMGNLELYKTYSGKDILYYDYESSNLMSVNQSKEYESKKNGSLNNLNNLPQTSTLKSQVGKSTQNVSYANYYSPQSDGFTMPKKLINKDGRYQEFSDELLKSQQNLYQIVDFQDQVINQAFNQSPRYVKQLNKSEHMKSHPNLYQNKITTTNLQNLIIPNQDLRNFESDEKVKRNI